MGGGFNDFVWFLLQFLGEMIQFNKFDQSFWRGWHHVWIVGRTKKLKKQGGLKLHGKKQEFARYTIVSKLLNFLNVCEVDVKPTPNRPHGLRADFHQTKVAICSSQRWPETSGWDGRFLQNLCKEIGCNLMKMRVMYRTIQSEGLDRMCQHDYSPFLMHSKIDSHGK